MALPYKVIQKEDKYFVLETTTDKFLAEYTDQKEAKKHCKLLNLGGGFDGNTPDFIVSNNSILLTE